MGQTAFLTNKSVQTAERVLNVAIRLFAEKGYAATTMRDISRASALGLGALYYYFRSKEEIVLRFYERSAQLAVDAFRAQPEFARPLPDAVAGFMRQRITQLAPYRDLLRVVLKEAIDPVSPLSPFGSASRPVMEQILGVFQDMVERSGTASGHEARQMAQALWLTHTAILLYWLHDRSRDFAMTERAITLLASALRLNAMLQRLPGAKSARRELFALISPLFAGIEPAEALPVEHDLPEPSMHNQ